jgi:hypothetical protein
MVGALGPVPDRIERRLAAVRRRSGSVLLAADAWAGAEVRLRVTGAVWEGVGPGHGLLRGRRVRIVAAGRGAAGRARQTELWLPGPDGSVAPVSEVPSAAGAPDGERAGLRVVGGTRRAAR